MIHSHFPQDPSAKRTPLRTACGKLIDPADRDMLSRLASTVDEARLQNVDCEACGEAIIARVEEQP